MCYVFCCVFAQSYRLDHPTAGIDGLLLNSPFFTVPHNFVVREYPPSISDCSLPFRLKNRGLEAMTHSFLNQKSLRTTYHLCPRHHMVWVHNNSLSYYTLTYKANGHLTRPFDHLPGSHSTLYGWIRSLQLSRGCPHRYCPYH